MGRGRSSFGGSSGGSRGSSSWGGSSSRGRSVRSSRSRTTVIIGGGHSGGNGDGSGSPVVGIVIGAFFAFFGLIMLLMGIYQCSQAFKYDKTSAICVGNEYSHGYYYSLYDYTVDGDKYEDVRSNEGWEFKEDIGKKVTIYYLKSDPDEISEECPADVETGIGEIVFSIVFGGIGVVAMVICIKQSKNVKKVAAPQVAETEKVEASTKIECPYCGSKYDKSLNGCPKCGASK